MSHTVHHPCTFRLQRSELAVPASDVKKIEKALCSSSDVVFLDLEDAVSPNEKVTARKNAIEALKNLNWQKNGKTISVRINSIDTHYMYRDLIDVIENAGQYLDTILIPKVGVPADIYMVEAMLSQIEAAHNIPHKIGIEALIETALGMMNVEKIASFGGRLEALHFGVADYAASTRAQALNIGETHPDYPGDQWHYPLSRMVVACRANGIRAIDGPFGDFKNDKGYIDSAKRARVLGCEGKWAIHPAQIDMANDVFTPTDAEIHQAQEILAAMAQAEQNNLGAVQLAGRMIDAASIKAAQNTIDTAKAIHAS